VIIHWFFIHTGTYNESGPYYGFFSGFGSDIGEVTLIALAVGGIRHLNCGHKGCWRPGRHTTKNGHKLCKKHIGWPNEALDLHPIHEDHR
jgi:hypothetical protein